MPGTEIAALRYVPKRCPILRYLHSATCLGSCYAMSSTEIRYHTKVRISPSERPEQPPTGTRRSRATPITTHANSVPPSANSVPHAPIRFHHTKGHRERPFSPVKGHASIYVPSAM
eukprot:558823-Rhodomonas_salina.1